MNKAEFLEKFPDLEGYTLGKLRIGIREKVLGFVLIDKEGNKRYILYIDDNIKIEPYW
jgi:hypothetical protein